MGGNVARRGFFAELNYQNQQAEKRRRQQAAATYRAQQAAEREAEKAEKQAVKAQLEAERSAALGQKAAAAQARQLADEARFAQAAALNAELASVYSQIDGLLAWTLEVDDYLDLESMRVGQVTHPPFEPGDLAVAVPPLPELVYPPQPEYVEPPAPKLMFGSKRKHEQAIAQARADYDAAYQSWHSQATGMYADYTSELSRRMAAEEQRVRLLAEARADYEHECRQREADAAAQDAQLDDLINGLAFDVESAIQDYVGLVLSNSVYPDAFPVTESHAFDLSTRELTLQVGVPDPSHVPSTREYKYVKSKGEITSTSLAVREQKDRYARAVWQVAIRTLHEIFEADRAGKIHSISLTVGAHRLSPATGLPELVPLVIVAAERDSFTRFQLASIVPQQTLAHLGAAMSKSPFDMYPADAGPSVRVRKS